MSNNESEIFYIIGSTMTILINFPEIIKLIKFKLQLNESIKHHKIIWLQYKKALTIKNKCFWLLKVSFI